MIKSFYILLLTLLAACMLYLMYGEIPAPTTVIEKVLPNEMFFGKKKASAAAEEPQETVNTGTED